MQVATGKSILNGIAIGPLRVYKLFYIPSNGPGMPKRYFGKLCIIQKCIKNLFDITDPAAFHITVFQYIFNRILNILHHKLIGRQHRIKKKKILII